jgi:hypothetical protein
LCSSLVESLVIRGVAGPVMVWMFKTELVWLVAGC